MFKIRGADQKEYGPVDADTIRHWIAQRRVDARTQVQAQGTTEWKAAGEIPEFKDALAAGAPAQSAGPPPMSAPVSPGVPAKTSGMAVTSLVMGLLGCLIIPAIVGLVLGIASLLRISRSDGRLKGKGLAIAGICLSGFSFVLLPIMAGLLLPALAKTKSKAQTIQCVNNLKQLALGVRLYANDNSDQYPPAATWCDSISSSISNPSVFRCNANPGQRSGFAFNQKLAGKKESEVDSQTVMLFEFGGGWNVAGGPELLPSRAPHGWVINVAFADGSVQQLPMASVTSLRWDP